MVTPLLHAERNIKDRDKKKEPKQPLILLLPDIDSHFPFQFHTFHRSSKHLNF